MIIALMLIIVCLALKSKTIKFISFLVQNITLENNVDYNEKFILSQILNLNFRIKIE